MKAQSNELFNLTDNLVPFNARQIPSSFIWCDPDLGDREKFLQTCSYIVNPSGTSPEKVFFAERYGGSGIQRNGGGARCGFDGQYQIKGIGTNPLVGIGSDHSHSNGALGAIHAIYEALWAEVLAQILPFGAVRARAVLLTDIYINSKAERSIGKSRRALLVRDPVIRPAHFERAPYFSPKPEYLKNLKHDSERIRTVIKFLPSHLPVPHGGFSVGAENNPRIYCIEGLSELARRMAYQMAFCRTRFLRLTTSPSNIAMDGRLMDFNALSSLFPGDYSNDFDYRLRLNELAKEPLSLRQGLSDLCLYLGKYLFDPSFTCIARAQIEDIFDREFRKQCYAGYLELLGINYNVLHIHEIPEILIDLVNSFLKFLNSSSGSLYRLNDESKKESPLGKLVSTMTYLAQGHCKSYPKELDKDILFNDLLRKFINATNWIVRNSESKEINLTSFLSMIELHARTKLQPRKCLNKTQLFEEISSALDNHAGNILYLQNTFNDIGLRMLNFSKLVFGTVNTPVNKTME